MVKIESILKTGHGVQARRVAYADPPPPSPYVKAADLMRFTIWIYGSHESESAKSVSLVSID